MKQDKTKRTIFVKSDFPKKKMITIKLLLRSNNLKTTVGNVGHVCCLVVRTGHVITGNLFPAFLFSLLICAAVRQRQAL
jgi:hypothetical protein